MGGLFGGDTPQQQNNATPIATSLRIQTALEGKPIARLWGQTRVTCNLIWYGAFTAYTIPVGNSGGGGGKGGIFGSPAAAGNTQTYYTVAVELAICEGAVSAIGPEVWSGKAITSMSGVGFAEFLGDDTQTAWSFLVAQFPTQALGYRNIAYAAGNINLGNSAELANFTFEVTGAIANAAAGITDANPADVVADFLANELSGVPGWSSAFNGDWTYPSSYWLATGLLVSFALTDQVAAGDFITTMLTALNAMPVWSDGVLKIVPLGDQSITAGAVTPATTSFDIPDTPDETPPYSEQIATGATFVADQGVVFTGSGTPLVAIADGATPSSGQYYVTPTGLYVFAAADQGINVTVNYTQSALASYNPPSAPIYALTDADYLPNQGGQSASTNNDPVAVQRIAPRQINNVIKAEFIDRSADYNPASVKSSNDASIRIYGERGSKGVQTWHFLQTRTAAQQAADLALGREKVANKYTFTGRPRFILLDPGDIIAITDEGLGLDEQWVRIKEIQENADRSLTITAEEYLLGTGAAPLYGPQANDGALPNYNEDPGEMNAPIIFEPTAELIGNTSLVIAIAASGIDTTAYAGCDVYISYDNLNYTLGSPRQFGAARMGVLTAELPSFTVNNVGPTIDTTSTLSVDLTESAGELNSGSQADALALNTACFVCDNLGIGEALSYQNADLTGANAYDLTYLVRGAYGTEDQIGIHPAGSFFARLDGNIIRVPYDQTRIGSTIYLKFVPFNRWGQGGKTVADVPAVAYVIQGTALKSPLPQITNFTSKFVDGRLNGTWDEIADFRGGIRYELRRGDTFDGAVSLGTVAHPPFPFPGDGVYWVTGWVQPVAGLIVNSEFPTSLEVVGATLNNNVVAIFDCKAEGWPGIFVNAAVDSGLDAVRNAGAGDILSISDILPEDDILNFGGVVSGTYRPAFVVDVGRVAPTQITITLEGTGIPIGQDILGVPDILAQPDILGAASAQFVDVFAKVLIAQSGVGSILDDTDVLATTDILTYGIPFAAGIKYSPGIYVGRVFAFEFDLNTIDPQTIALLQSATITVDVPDRIDSRAIISSVITSLTNVTVPAAGITMTFIPDGATEAAAFNGGPGGAPGSLPQIIVTWGDEQPGDVLQITGETLAIATVRILNSGIGVQRNKVNIFPRGY